MAVKIIEKQTKPFVAKNIKVQPLTMREALAQSIFKVVLINKIVA